MALAHPKGFHSAAAATTINPADFVPVIDNPYFPLTPGTTFVYEATDGSVDTFSVTYQTKVIDGVTCVVVEDKTTLDGQLAENTKDYFAQDTAGNVWYFGEFSRQYEGGHVVGREGSWTAGVHGAEPGIVMQAHPSDFVGVVYSQETAPGVAEDMAKVISLTETADVLYGPPFGSVLQTDEFTPLEPLAPHEQKFYAPDVGLVLTTVDGSPDLEQLVMIRIDGTSHDDTLVGMVGADELNGHQGSDTLTGGLGSDVFVFDSPSDGKDTITDFQTGAGGDTLDIHELLAGFGGGSDANDFVHLVESGGNTTVGVDANGAVGGGKFTDVCVLTGVTGATVDSLVADGNLVLA